MSRERPWEKWNDPSVVTNLDKDWSGENRQTQLAALKMEVETAIAEARLDIPNVLEVGCGLGHDFEAVLRGYVDRNEIRYGGMDVTPEMVERCKTKFPHLAGCFKVGDLYDIDLPPRSVDLVYCADVLVHLPDWEKPLDELARVCAGTLVLKLCYVIEGETRCLLQPSGFYDVWFNIHWVIKSLHDRGFKTISVVAVRPEESRDKKADLRQVFIARRGD